MATYYLNYTDLQSTLGKLKSSATQHAINNALTSAGLMPSGSQTLTTEIVSTPGSYTLANSGELFLYAGGSGTTATVHSAGGNVLADPGNIRDFNNGSVSDTLVGGDGSVKLTSETGNNSLLAGWDATTLQGGSGADTLYSGYGTADLIAGAGNNQILRGGRTLGAHDTLTGGAGSGVGLGVLEGNNSLEAGSGGNTLWGGSGADTLYSGYGNARLNAGTGDNQVLRGGRVAGAHDTLAASSGASRLGVLEGDNVLGAGSANSSLWAGSGNDTLYGGSGHDMMFLGAGNTSVAGGSGFDTVATGSGNATIFGGHSTTVNETNSQAGITSQTVVNGVTQIIFGDGQRLDSKNVTINFAGGGKITT